MPRLTPGLVALLAVLGAAIPASAHRLDEYLQALRVDVRADGIVVELDLTPGANLAADVVAALDTNADAAIDPSEADAYVSSVMGSLEASVDDRRVALDLVGRTVPSLEEVRRGTGVISLVARDDFDKSSGGHRLSQTNVYRKDDSV